MNLRRTYRRWMWKRLGLLLPSLATSAGAILWLTLSCTAPSSVRIPCLSLAVLLFALLGYLNLLTLACSRPAGKLPLQQARAYRRQLSPWGPLCAFSLLCLAALVLAPEFYGTPVAPSSPRMAGGARIPKESIAAPPVEEALPETSRPLAVAPEAPVSRPVVPDPPAIPAPSPAPGETPAPVEAQAQPPAEAPVPAPVPVKDQKPAVRSELAIEPSHLMLDEREPLRSDRIDVPYLPKPAESPLAETAGVEETLSPLTVDREQFSTWHSHGTFVLGLAFRPLPDENDPSSWPFPEGRVEGFLLVGSGGVHVPGISLALDLPFGREDSILISWTGARLPEPLGVEASMRPDWNHLTLAYTRRLAGYTQHATFDLAVSVGVSADFFRATEGIPDPGSTPKLAPYAAADLAFWQHEPIGLLLHIGEALPVTVVGSSLGMTDLSAQIRWDLSERVSLHGGYRVLLLRYKSDDFSKVAAADTLHDQLSGPILGLDIRF